MKRIGRILAMLTFLSPASQVLSFAARGVEFALAAPRPKAASAVAGECAIMTYAI